MAHSFKSVEGIILRVIPFGDYDQIVSLFTEEVGVIKLFFKGCRSKRDGLPGVCMPLTYVQVVYRERQKSELVSCHEMTLVEPYRFLKQDLTHLETACELLKMVEATQLPGKPAPRLFALLLYFLARLPECVDPAVLVYSFRLKLLKHEGELAFPLSCSVCQVEITAPLYYVQEECFCSLHVQSGAFSLADDELRLIEHLATSQSFSSLATLMLSQELKGKISYFFAC